MVSFLTSIDWAETPLLSYRTRPDILPCLVSRVWERQRDYERRLFGAGGGGGNRTHVRKVAPVGMSPAVIARSDVERNGEAGAIQLIGQIPRTPREVSSQRRDPLGQGKGSLLNRKLPGEKGMVEDAAADSECGEEIGDRSESDSTRPGAAPHVKARGTPISPCLLRPRRMNLAFLLTRDHCAGGKGLVGEAGFEPATSCV